MKPKVLVFAGSSRKESFNKSLVKIALSGAVDAGADVTFICLEDYPLPIFCQDLEAKEGMPDNALKLKELFKSHHALLISSPEYNGSVTALLKNVIDWVSRPGLDEPAGLLSFQGKFVGLLSTSPGRGAAQKSLNHLKAIFEHMNVQVIAHTYALASASHAFDEQRDLVDRSQAVDVKAMGSALCKALLGN